MQRTAHAFISCSAILHAQCACSQAQRATMLVNFLVNEASLVRVLEVVLQQTDTPDLEQTSKTHSNRA
jgi:hypothetical protein